MALSGKKRRKRHFGDKIDFKSLACAPINENGVIYLFGVLHDTLGLKIESIQAGFPDCISRRCVGRGRWEELRIEFEFKSRNFMIHGHDPDGVEMIVCWEHDWKGCPEHIEVIELSSMVPSLEKIKEDVRDKKDLSSYQIFAGKMVKDGYSFKEIGKLWREHKRKTADVVSTSDNAAPQKKPNKLSEYQKFVQSKIRLGHTLKEASKMWKEK